MKDGPRKDLLTGLSQDVAILALEPNPICYLSVHRTPVYGQQRVVSANGSSD
jgi:hypothetical protein